MINEESDKTREQIYGGRQQLVHRLGAGCRGQGKLLLNHKSWGRMQKLPGEFSRARAPWEVRLHDRRGPFWPENL